MPRGFVPADTEHAYETPVGLAGYFASLQRFRWEVIKIWRKWLGRRGDPKGMSWERMNRLLDFFYLPEARVVHSIYTAKP